MITAAEARENLTTYCNNHIGDILAEISERIENASKNGDSMIRIFEFNEEISKMITKACRRKGYKVTNYFDGVSIISWR